MKGPTNDDGALNGAGQDARRVLSSLMDGDADEGTVARACTAWRGHAQARADWHAYNLIGDVLRAGDQGPSARGDAAFVQAFRQRLEREPVVLAPPVVEKPTIEQPTIVQSAVVAAVRQGVASSARGWRAPFAAAAGVAAVASVVFVMRPGTTDPSEIAAVRAEPPAAVAQGLVSTRPASSQPTATALVGAKQGASGGASGGATPIVVVHDPRMLRDERLDQYLDAHRQFSESAWSVAPAGTVRGVSTLAPER